MHWTPSVFSVGGGGGAGVDAIVRVRRSPVSASRLSVKSVEKKRDSFSFLFYRLWCVSTAGDPIHCERVGGLMTLLTRDRRKNGKNKQKENKYRLVKKRWHTHRRRLESLWWWELTMFSGCRKHDHVISAAELLHFLSPSAASVCSTSRLNKAEDSTRHLYIY